MNTEMVLFHSTFLALKSRSPLTITIDPFDYRLSGEKRVFTAKIVDDEFHHSLGVFQDSKTGGLRLVASVWGGELVRCPVWIAFGISPPPIHPSIYLDSRYLVFLDIED